MRIIMYIVILALLFLAPIERMDVADLLPIEAVAVYAEDGKVVLETDTENIGRGENAVKALENLKETTAAVVYLDTAEYLIVSEETEEQIAELRKFLKPSVQVCIADAKGRVKDVAKYVDIHGDTVRLKHWKRDQNTP